MYTQDFPKEESVGSDWCVCVCWGLWAVGGGERWAVFLSLDFPHRCLLCQGQRSGRLQAHLVDTRALRICLLVCLFILHNKPILTLATPLRSQQARHFQSLAVPSAALIGG